ncbi:MAG: hypothetical protein ACLFTK_04405 [Anaerolineales bacterium]
MARQLDMVADLTLTINDEVVVIQGDGDTLVVDLPSVRAVRALVQPIRQYAPLRAGARRLAQGWGMTGVQVLVRLQGQPIATLAPGAGGWFARQLGYPALDIQPVGLFRALVRGKGR